jgi:hypothetical protein
VSEVLRLVSLSLAILFAVAVSVLPASGQTPLPTNQEIYNRTSREVDSRCGSGTWKSVVTPTLRQDNEKSAVDFDGVIRDARTAILAAESCLDKFGICADTDVWCAQASIQLEDYVLYSQGNLRYALHATNQNALAVAALRQEIGQALKLCKEPHITDHMVASTLARDDLEHALDMAERLVKLNVQPGNAKIGDLSECAKRIGSKHFSGGG